MFNDLTAKHWEVFFTVIHKLSVGTENYGCSESELMQAIWDKAESEGYYSELSELVFGLHECRTGEVFEEESTGKDDENFPPEKE